MRRLVVALYSLYAGSLPYRLLCDFSRVGMPAPEMQASRLSACNAAQVHLLANPEDAAKQDSDWISKSGYYHSLHDVYISPEQPVRVQGLTIPNHHKDVNHAGSYVHGIDIQQSMSASQKE